jgi:hypothetical protein
VNTHRFKIDQSVNCPSGPFGAGNGAASMIAPDNARNSDRRLYMMTLDYAASAELFMPKRKSGARQLRSYWRFATAAEAIRFAVEEFPSIRTLGAWMKVGEERFNGDEIRRLFESTSSPRRRRLRKSGRRNRESIST